MSEVEELISFVRAAKGQVSNRMALTLCDCLEDAEDEVMRLRKALGILSGQGLLEQEHVIFDLEPRESPEAPDAR